MPFIEMKASRLHDDGHAFESAGDEQPLVTGDAGLGESGDRVVGNSNRIGDFVGEEPEA